MDSSGIDFLLGRINYERRSVLPYNAERMKLENMRELLRRLGNPDHQYPVVHIAGTKGKGSVASMLSSILAFSGQKVGTYTSPHLDHLCERFHIRHLDENRRCFPAELEELIEIARPEVLSMDEQANGEAVSFDRPTFFEITTAIAFLHFARQAADIAVIETGLGGRLDSTNVCSPVLSIITSISFDHTRQLGNTLGEIALEKAGIIKPKIPVISGVLDDEPRHVIRQIAEKNNSDLFELDVDFLIEDSSSPLQPRLNSDARNGNGQFRLPEPAEFSFRLAANSASKHDSRSRFDRIENLRCGLAGKHQQRNAAVAIAAAWQLSNLVPSMDNKSIRAGMLAAELPGRIELVRNNPPVICDVAHNVASAQALVDTIGTSISGRDNILIYATSRDKDFEGSLQLLLPHFKTVYFTRFLENPRARMPQELIEFAEQFAADSDPEGAHEFRRFDSPQAAWDAASRRANDRSVICITGSAFIVAELRPICLAESNSRKQEESC